MRLLLSPPQDSCQAPLAVYHSHQPFGISSMPYNFRYNRHSISIPYLVGVSENSGESSKK